MIRETESQRASLYRSRDGMIFGVCKGLAEHFDFPVFWMRVAACGLLSVSKVWPMVIVYFIAAFFMKPEPLRSWEPGEEEERKFYNADASSHPLTLHHLKRAYDNLDRRIQRMEDIVTNREYDWERRLHQ